MDPTAYGFEIRAATKEQAKKVIEQRIALEGAGCNCAAAVAASHALMDDMPAPAGGEQLLVVLSGVSRGADGRQTEESLGCSVYIVPADEREFAPEPGDAPQPGEVIDAEAYRSALEAGVIGELPAAGKGTEA